MSYVSDHALYGVGHYGSLGATSTADGKYLQLQANIAAGLLGLAQISVDGIPGAKTLALLNAIASKTSNLGPVAFGPPLNTNDMVSNASSLASFLAQATIPALKNQSAAAAMPWASGPLAFTSPAAATAAAALSPAVAASGDKTASKVTTSFSIARRPMTGPGMVGESFLTKKVMGLPMWVLLTGAGVAALLVMRGRRSAPVAAVVAVPVVPKGA